MITKYDSGYSAQVLAAGLLIMTAPFKPHSGYSGFNNTVMQNTFRGLFGGIIFCSIAYKLITQLEKYCPSIFSF